MSYEKRTTSFMSDLPTAYNRPAAMAGWHGISDDAGEIEMPVDYVGKGANASIVSEPPPATGVLEFFKSLFGSSTGLVHEAANAATPATATRPPPPGVALTRPSLLSSKTLLLVGAGVAAYYFIKKKG